MMKQKRHIFTKMYAPYRASALNKERMKHMKIRRKFIRLFAVVLVMSCVLTVLLPVSTAAEARITSNGYSSTNVTYDGKTYTIFLGVGGCNDKVARVTAHCAIDDIKIIIGNVTVKFDTKNYGYVTNVGAGVTDRTSEKYSYFYITTSDVVCSKGTAQVVKVLNVNSSAVFKDVNNGQDVSLSVGFTG